MEGVDNTYTYIHIYICTGSVYSSIWHKCTDGLTDMTIQKGVQSLLSKKCLLLACPCIESTCSSHSSDMAEDGGVRDLGRTVQGKQRLSS